jgi:ABC-type multidrug transport system permease subunit
VAVLFVLTFNGAMPVSGLPAVLVVIAATWFTGVVIGFALSGAVSDIFVIGQVANIAGLVFTVIPPVYYPLAMLPVPWQWVAMIVPTTNAAQLIRLAGGVAETTPVMVALHWTILFLWVAAAGFTVVRTSRWQER